MGHWYCPPGRKGLQAIPADKLPEMIGQPIHLKEFPPAHRFTLVEVAGSTIVVSRNRQSFTAKASGAQYLRTAKKV